jgi:hypothetical protein
MAAATHLLEVLLVPPRGRCLAGDELLHHGRRRPPPQAPRHTRCVGDVE